MRFVIYMIGLLILIGGLAWAAITAGAPSLYVLIGAVILLGARHHHWCLAHHAPVRHWRYRLARQRPSLAPRAEFGRAGSTPLAVLPIRGNGTLRARAIRKPDDCLALFHGCDVSDERGAIDELTPAGFRQAPLAAEREPPGVP